MKNRTRILRYLLIAIAWYLVYLSMRRPVGDLNGFLGWNGQAETWFFLRWLFELPGQLAKDVHAGVAVSSLDLLWMLMTLLGLFLLLTAPILIHLARGRRARLLLRCTAFDLLFLPLSFTLPASCHFPIAASGLWLLAAAHLLACLALILAEKRPDPATAFPITLKPS